jgi:hypothetical protein
VINDIGPVLSEKGLARIAGYAGKDGCRSAPGTMPPAYVKDINACAFPDNSGRGMGQVGAPRLRAGRRRPLALRYDPNIAIALQTGKLRPTSLAGAHGVPRLAHKRPVLLVRGRCPTCWNRARPHGCGAPRRHAVRRSAERRPCADADRTGGAGRDPQFLATVP